MTIDKCLYYYKEEMTLINSLRNFILVRLRLTTFSEHMGDDVHTKTALFFS